LDQEVNRALADTPAGPHAPRASNVAACYPLLLLIASSERAFSAMNFLKIRLKTT
jgi:hypothetical protein